MKALVYEKAHSLNQFAIKLAEIDMPELKDYDVLVRIKAVGFNPVDYKIRQSRSANEAKPVVLGWDAAGVIEQVGSKVSRFKVGDEVYYAGDVTRDGSYAEYQAVDSRVVSLKPKTISFAEAAAVPLTAITAYEALIEQTITPYTAETSVLIIGGAGGVGSMGIQLLKQLTPAKVIATASRPESRAWCKKLGADFVVDHTKNLKEELSAIGYEEVDFVFSTTQTDKYVSLFPEIIRPFGHIALIDDPATFDLKPFKPKAIIANFELMFTKTMFQYDMESQGKLLKHVADLIDENKVTTTLNKEFKGLKAEHVKEAHAILESGVSVGKMVMNISN